MVGQNEGQQCIYIYICPCPCMTVNDTRNKSANARHSCNPCRLTLTNANVSIHTPIRGRRQLDTLAPSVSLFFFNPRPVGRQAVIYRVNSRTAAANPTAKACFCQSSHSCNKASSVSKLTAGAIASICLCSDSGSNKSGSRLHSPSYRASNSGFMASPLTFAASSAIIDFAAFWRCVGL